MQSVIDNLIYWCIRYRCHEFLYFGIADFYVSKYFCILLIIYFCINVLMYFCIQVIMYSCILYPCILCPVPCILYPIFMYSVSLYPVSLYPCILFRRIPVKCTHSPFSCFSSCSSLEIRMMKMIQDELRKHEPFKVKFFC